MVRRVVVGLLVLVGVGVGWVLGSAHVGIRRVRPPLPSIEAVRATVAAATAVPVRLRWIDTSSQEVPRSGVLGGADPHPERPYRLSHSSFVLEWADGRILLIDAGMTREQAASFGGIAEWIGAGPIEVHTTVAEALGARRRDVAGVVFTHLHVDHVEGVTELCRDRDSSRIAVFMTPEQAGSGNFTTNSVKATVESLDCLDRVQLQGDNIAELDGFPGIYVIAAGGHTPGSQIVVAAVERAQGRHVLAFTGDIVNNIDGIEYDVGKPFLYRLLIVPEADDRLGELRRFLRSLRDRAGFELLVSHDQLALQRSSVPRYGSPSARVD
jgi:glyoxylase-like metal-dependent hydrolase (beta-lactamase superfamily II)